MRELGKSAADRVVMFKRFPQDADMPADFVRAYVVSLRESGRGTEADALLEKHFLPPKEGAAPLQSQSREKSGGTSRSRHERSGGAMGEKR